MPKKFGKQQHQQTDFPPLLFTMGELDLVFRIDFREDDLEKLESENKSGEKESKEENNNYYKLEDINTLKDLSFIKENEDLWDRIKLKPGNDNIKLLLIGNKNSKKKYKLNIFVSEGQNSKKTMNTSKKFLNMSLIEMACL